MGGEHIGKLLVDGGLLEEPGLERALKLQAESGQRLTTVLVSLGLVAERDLAEMLAEKFGLQVVPPHAYGAGPVVGNAVSPDFLRQVQAVPVADRNGTVEVAIGDPFDSYALDALQLALGRPVEAKVGVISEIEGAIEKQYGNGAANLARLPDGTWLSDEFVRELSIDVMKAHIEATDKSVRRGDRGWLTNDQIDRYHQKIFKRHGLPEAAYGGWWASGSYYCPDCQPEPLLGPDADCLAPRLVWGCLP